MRDEILLVTTIEGVVMDLLTPGETVDGETAGTVSQRGTRAKTSLMYVHFSKKEGSLLENAIADPLLVTKTCGTCCAKR